MTSLRVGLNLGMRQIDYIYKNFDPISFSKNVKNYKKYSELKKGKILISEFYIKE